MPTTENAVVSTLDVSQLVANSEMSRVQKALKGLMAQVPYGSRLYGTNTATSDYDYKCVYLPAFEDVMLGRKFTNFKARFDAEGNVFTDPGRTMPDNGYEMEFVALQTLLKDWLEGQTYAVEVVFALTHGFYTEPPEGDQEQMNRLVFLLDTAYDMRKFYRSNAVSGMVGFAMKQTFDYVHRGERLKEAEFFLNVLDKVKTYGCSEVKGNFRLDSVMRAGVMVGQDAEGNAVELYRLDTDMSVYDYVMAEVAAGGMGEAMKSTVTMNAGTPVRSVTFAGRHYLETTPLFELRKVVEARVKSYGSRSKDAKENTVDTKSLMHAVRVYEQVLEYLESGSVVFPRPNPQELLKVRTLETPMEEVVEKLRDLDAKVQEAQKLHPPKVEELREDYEEFMLRTLCYAYDVTLNKR